METPNNQHLTPGASFLEGARAERERITNLLRNLEEKSRKGLRINRAEALSEAISAISK